MVKLNQSAAAILARCNGSRTVADIVTDLESTYGLAGLTQDVCAFIAMALERTWLELRA
jgi:pyrroloquinoline quinone biosynthesis protein D